MLTQVCASIVGVNSKCPFINEGVNYPWGIIHSALRPHPLWWKNEEEMCSLYPGFTVLSDMLNVFSNR